MIISPQIGLHEDVFALDHDNEYANLIVNHNLSYETVGGGWEAARKGLLPTVVERFLNRGIYFKNVKRTYSKEESREPDYDEDKHQLEEEQEEAE